MRSTEREWCAKATSVIYLEPEKPRDLGVLEERVGELQFAEPPRWLFWFTTPWVPRPARGLHWEVYSVLFSVLVSNYSAPQRRRGMLDHERHSKCVPSSLVSVVFITEEKVQNKRVCVSHRFHLPE